MRSHYTITTKKDTLETKAEKKLKRKKTRYYNNKNNTMQCLLPNRPAPTSYLQSAQTHNPSLTSHISKKTIRRQPTYLPFKDYPLRNESNPFSGQKTQT